MVCPGSWSRQLLLSSLCLLLLLAYRPAQAQFTLNFGNVRVGQHKDKDLVYTTYGDYLTVDNTFISPTGEFSIVSDHMTGGPYAPGTSIDAVIRYAPVANGSHQAAFGGSCTALSGGGCTFATTNLVGSVPEAGTLLSFGCMLGLGGLIYLRRRTRTVLHS